MQNAECRIMVDFRLLRKSSSFILAFSNFKTLKRFLRALEREEAARFARIQNAKERRRMQNAQCKMQNYGGFSPFAKIFIKVIIDLMG